MQIDERGRVAKRWAMGEDGREKTRDLEWLGANAIGSGAVRP